MMKLPVTICSAILVGAAAFAAVPAMAATVNEGSFAGGDFSNSATAPTFVGYGYDTVTGTTDGGNGGSVDIFAFTGLNPGAQTLTFTFAAPSGIGYSFASGGSIYYSTTPFQWNWDGTYGGTFNVGYSNPTSTASFSLGSGFSGSLYVGLYGWGPGIAYTVSVPGNAPVSPVPVPAAALLLGGALVGLGAFGRRAKPAAA